MRCVALHELDHVELKSRSSGEQFSRSAVLTDSLELSSLFIHHEILPPGRRSSLPHRHAQSEEVFVILKGTVTALEGTASQILQAGECVSFPAGTTDVHMVVNRTDREAELLVISTPAKTGDVVFGDLPER